MRKNRKKLSCEISFGEVLGVVLIWLIIVAVTAGIGAIFMPFYVTKFILDRTYVEEVYEGPEPVYIEEDN